MSREGEKGAPLRVVIVGAGAVGAVFGSHLARTGADVTFIARGITLATMRTHGLLIDGPAGAHRLEAGASTDDPSTLAAADVVLVSVKAEQVAGIAPSLRALVHEGTAIIPMQNGVEASEQLADAIAGGHVVEGLCRMLAEQVAPAHVQYGGPTPVIAFGTRAGETLRPQVAATLDRLAALFEAAGVIVERPADMTAALWEKFLFVEPLGVVGGAARSTFGELLGTPETRAALLDCVREIDALARAAGVALAADAVTRMWARYETLPPTGTTSMQRDLVSGRRSELEAQTGAVVRLGARHGVAVPVHAALYAVLRPQELRARL